MPNHAYHVTSVTAHRRPWFKSFDGASAAASAFTDSLSMGDATLMAWVLMPDHAHWLLQLGPHDTLGRVVSRMKARSSAAVNNLQGGCQNVWARAYHDHAIRDTEDLRNVARYIVANPLRAGLVQGLGDYPFWDAVWL